MNKKAIAMAELALMILAVVAGIVLIFFGQTTFEKTSCAGDIKICQNSFAFYKGIKEKAGVLGIAPKVDCIAVSPPNCEEKELETEDSQKTMHIIAENLRHCWEKTLGRDNTMGEDFGEVVILPRGGPIVGKEDDVDFCLVCSEFVTNVDINAQEWNDYLDSKKVFGKETTYEDFLNPVDYSIWGKSYRGVDFKKGEKNYVVSVSAEESKGDGKVYIYVDSDISCGDEDPQIHYQLR